MNKLACASLEGKMVKNAKRQARRKRDRKGPVLLHLISGNAVFNKKKVSYRFYFQKASVPVKYNFSCPLTSRARLV